MNLTFNEVNNIVNTLPVGYYIGRNIEIELVQGQESYYDAMNDTIKVSYNMLNDVLQGIDDNENPEETVRTLTYHEVSHALLTPRPMKMTRVRNIFEDERIETLLRKFYHMTDFKRFLLRATKFKGEKPTSVEEAFYHLVRFRIGKKEFLERVANLIEKYKKLSQVSFNTYGVSLYNYELDIDNLWYDFQNDYRDEKRKENESSESESNDENESSSDGSQNESQEENDSNEDMSGLSDEELQEQAASKVMKQFEADTNEESFSIGAAEDLIHRVIDAYTNPELTEQVQSILSRISKTSSRNGSAINAYSGVFDPRSVIRDDYKYFVQQNRNGHVKAYAKVHLTLVIDKSGSFRSSEATANSLLHALHVFEKQNPDFSFDLITCGFSEELAPKSQRKIIAEGGNLLDYKIFELMKRTQQPGALNYNIIMFDGDAFTDSYYCRTSMTELSKNFKAFNLPNATIISDASNETHIRKHCKNAKIIICDNYVEELITNTIIALQNLTR